MDIRPCTVSEIENAPNIGELTADYTEEAGHSFVPMKGVQFESYRAMEAAGVLRPIGAFDGDRLVGFIGLIVHRAPHYGVVIGAIETFYVAPEFRAGGTGLKMLRLAESMSKELGAVGTMLSAPFGGRLAQAAPQMGYRPANQLFFKVIE